MASDFSDDNIDDANPFDEEAEMTAARDEAQKQLDAEGKLQG